MQPRQVQVRGLISLSNFGRCDIHRQDFDKRWQWEVKISFKWSKIHQRKMNIFSPARPDLPWFATMTMRRYVGRLSSISSDASSISFKIRYTSSLLPPFCRSVDRACRRV
ncbi:hypothetical protein FOWG_13429 [Fusarium oxysporum f. sp. lycopersici MN25]|uniref:Uncharacterized protein n=1 Tax=Fusarium oxysporum Fo47 TaxID=660027 RepID=W9JMU6_FUSOX|nr:hypothetical protein FOZG_13145 [Fusarium oxysporum Fo47]EWZ83561.1 hypothetical protein FOWG_13429 [Fusarium oxysporum f. sp. lycopersici MN25]